MGTLGPEKVWLAITPVPGNNSYGAPICGEVRETPTPTPDESATASPARQRRPDPDLQGNPRSARRPPPFP